MSYDIEKLVEKIVKEQKMNAPANAAPQAKTLTLAVARRAVEMIKAKASEMGVKAVVAVADKGANLMTVDSMDGAYIASWDIAANKAFTSVSLKMSTHELSKLAAPGGSLYGIQFTNNGRIVIFGGGEPIMSGDEVIGGVGVSGGTAEEDTFLGSFAKKTFEELLK